jgi:hypothetical protein
MAMSVQDSSKTEGVGARRACGRGWRDGDSFYGVR